MRVLIGDLLTGRRILDVPFTTSAWGIEVNGSGEVSCSVDLRDPEVQRLDLRNAATLGKSFLAVVENDIIMEAGPIWGRNYDRSSGLLSLQGRGLWSYFEHRTCMPYIGNQPVVDPVTGESATYANTNLSGLHLGTIGKRYVQQSMTWPGGNLPIVFEDDKPGTHERNVVGAELPIIGTLLENLTQVEGGPDIAFIPQWTEDRLGVRWKYVSGDPRISSASVHLIDTTVAGSPVDEFAAQESASSLASLAWASGGRAGNEALVERHFNTSLVDAGFPLIEVVDSSRSSVQEAATLRAYAVEAAANGARSLSVWDPTIKVGQVGEPRIGEFTAGDYLIFKTGDDPFIHDGRHRRRIMTLSGDDKSRTVKLGLGESNG